MRAFFRIVGFPVRLGIFLVVMSITFAIALVLPDFADDVFEDMYQWLVHGSEY